MSNIEAKFDKYLDSLSISRARKDRVKTHWNKYLRYLKERFNKAKPDMHDDPLKSVLVSAYVDRVARKSPTGSRAQSIRSSFDAFRSYLNREKILEKKQSELQEQYKSLLLRYLSDLDQKNTASATIRNYQADLLQSFLFLSSSYKDHDIRREKRLPDQFERDYQIHLKNTLHLSDSSIRRKMSTLNSFLHWAEKRGHCMKAAAVFDLTDRQDVIESPSTLPSFSADREIAVEEHPMPAAKHFHGTLSFISLLLTLIFTGTLYYRIQSMEAIPSKPHIASSPAGSVLRYEGRLTDESGRSIIEKTTATFRLWDDQRDGTIVYDSQQCVIEPDQNGIFSVLIGSSCGKNIPANLLTGHLPLYLGITLGDGDEFSPRQAIATASLTENSLKLAGLQTENPASTMSIPYINANGRLSISAASPVVESQKGVFTLEGQSMVLRTTERTGGSITLSPDDLGTVNVVFTDSLGRDSGGMMNIRNTNMITGTLLSLRGSVLTSGYNFIDLQSGNDATSRFRVDAGGNTTIGGSLSIENALEASSGGILMKTDMVNTGLTYDGGLGIYGSKGNPVPVPVDFTRPTRIEFGFKISAEAMYADINLSEDRLKFYRVFWNPDATMGISVCTPTCSIRATSSLIRNESIWHHGYIEFTAGTLHWNIDNNKAKISVRESPELPAMQKAYMRFSHTLPAISQLRVSQTESTILSSGNAQIGSSLVAAGNIMSEGQIRTGNFSSEPTTAGSGATYFNTTDNMLYYWNGTSWVSDAFWKREGNSLYPHPLYAANLNLGIGTTTPEARLHVQDASQEQLRLSWDTTHFARFVASSSGTLAIDPNDDLLVAGDLSIGDGGLFYPSENATHAQQSHYYLTADTSGGGQIRTNALGFGASGSDFAEVFVTQEPVEVGDVVTLGNTQIQQSIYSIAKSDTAYSDKIIGVVTDRAAFIGGLNSETAGKPTATVGILGRVPIHVSAENGPIQRGDPLASSGIPGYAMRATERGPVIARALEDFSPADSSARSTILSFVQSGWFEPSGPVDIAGNLLLDDPGLGELVVGKAQSIYHSSKSSANQLFMRSANFLSLQTENLEAAKATIRETLHAAQITTSTMLADTIYVRNSANVGKLKTALIEPPQDEADLTVRLPDTVDGFGRLLIENDSANIVASIDSAGNATFSGTIQAESGTFSGIDIDQDASIAGTLYAKSIVSDDFQSLQSSFSALLARFNTPSTTEAPDSPATPSPTPPTELSAIEPILSIAPVASAALPDNQQENYQSDVEIANVSLASPDNLIDQLPSQLDSLHSLQDRVNNFMASSSAFIASAEAIKGNFPLRISETIQIPPNLRIDSLFVTGSTTLADTAVAGQLFVDGSLLLENNSIRSLSETLSFTAEKAISLMGDKLIVDASGNLTTSGWLIAQKGVLTNRIASSDGTVTIDIGKTHPLPEKDDHTSLTDNIHHQDNPISLPRIGAPAEPNESFGTLMIQGNDETPVTTIDSTGNVTTEGRLTASEADIRGTLHADKISLDQTPTASSSGNYSISAADHFINQGINAPAVYAVTSAGAATIPAGSHELYIYYSGISENSLLYITPTSPTQNRTLFVADKKKGSHAVIGLDVAISTPIQFNWWIIN